MNKPLKDDEYGTPDEETPEWTDEDFRWSVRVKDFGDVVETTSFLSRRATILKAGEAAGLPKEFFWQFAPTKPGFEDRVSKALGALVETIRHAAE